MKRVLKSVVRGGILAGLIGLGGCVYRVRGPALTVSAEPVPIAYDEVYYEPVYYDAGWYDGPYWYWYGPDHRRYREIREYHERRYYGRYHRHWR